MITGGISNIHSFQSTEQGDVQCDGSLSSFIEVGLKVVLQKLLHHDMDTVVTMLTNMVGYIPYKHFRIVEYEDNTFKC